MGAKVFAWIAVASVISRSAKAFKRDFPNYAYQNEDDKRNRPAGEPVFTESFNTATKKNWLLPVQAWESGHYLLTLNTQDKYGQAIEVKKYFELFDLTSEIFSGIEAIWVNQPNKPFEPRDTAAVSVGTGLAEIYALVEIEKRENCIVEYGGG